MADISTGRQRGIVPFVDETTGRLPDQYLPQGVIDLQGDLEQAVSDAGASATAAKASAGEAVSSASAAKSSETAAAKSAQTATEQVSSIGDSVERAAASATAAQQSASQAQSNATAANSSAQAAAASAESAQTATESAASSKDAAARSASQASESAQAAEASKTNAAASASVAKVSETNAAASATAAQQAVGGFGLEVGTTTTGEPGSDAAVEIQKNGTKYTANFTIPKGDKGEQASVTHDGTLTGDGTSGTPLGVAVGSALNQGVTTALQSVDFNDYISPGIYGMNSKVAQNAPSGMNGLIRAVIFVSLCGFRSSDGVVLQTLFVRNINSSDLGIYMRGLRNGTWDEWKRLASAPEVSAVTASTSAMETKTNELAAMQTQLQALETRIKSLETNQ